MHRRSLRTGGSPQGLSKSATETKGVVTPFFSFETFQIDSVINMAHTHSHTHTHTPLRNFKNVLTECGGGYPSTAFNTWEERRRGGEEERRRECGAGVEISHGTRRAPHRNAIASQYRRYITRPSQSLTFGIV